MSQFEYKVLPAPTRGRKAAGVKTPEARFALGLEETLNDMAREGWVYLRSDILPSEERQGLTSTHTVYRSVLVFQREVTVSHIPETDVLQEDVAAEPLAQSLSPPPDRD